MRLQLVGKYRKYMARVVISLPLHNMGNTCKPYHLLNVPLVHEVAYLMHLASITVLSHGIAHARRGRIGMYSAVLSLQYCWGAQSTIIQWTAISYYCILMTMLLKYLAIELSLAWFYLASKPTTVKTMVAM